MGLNSLIGLVVPHLHPVAQHVLRQGQHDGAGTPGGCSVVGARQILRNAAGIVDLCDPFGELAVHPPVIDFLKGLPVDHGTPDLPDEKDHRRGVLLGDMHAGRGVCRTRPPGHETNPWLAGDTAIGVRHHRGATFLAADRGLNG